MSPEQLLQHYDQGADWPGGCGLDVAQAYERALAVRALRIAHSFRLAVAFNRGETTIDIEPITEEGL